MTKKILTVLCCVALLFTLPASTVRVHAQNYSLYGTVTYPGGSVVANAIVNIYKYENGSYVFIGSTQASVCGYYTFNLGGTGNYRAYVNGTYNLRYGGTPCGSVFDNEPVAGDAYGTVTWWNPHLVLNVGTA
jgi:hypothetical protein